LEAPWEIIPISFFHDTNLKFTKQNLRNCFLNLDAWIYFLKFDINVVKMKSYNRVPFHRNEDHLRGHDLPKADGWASRQGLFW
jgi:hypothetical protein